MRRKSKLSSKILASTSWQKNYKTMTELKEVEKELDEAYKARRVKAEEEAINKLKKNPKFSIATLRGFQKPTARSLPSKPRRAR